MFLGWVHDKICIKEPISRSLHAEVNRKLYKGRGSKYVYSFHRTPRNKGGEGGGVIVVVEGRMVKSKALYIPFRKQSN
jgi:hypothetical protein